MPVKAQLQFAWQTIGCFRFSTSFGESTARISNGFGRGEIELLDAIANHRAAYGSTRKADLAKGSKW